MGSEPPIWITGLGFITSLGHSPADVAARLRAGKTGIQPHSFDPDRPAPVTLAAPLPDFDHRSAHWSEWRWPAPFHPPKRLLRALPPHGLYGFCALTAAFADAGWSEEDIRGETVGFYAASAGSPQMSLHYLGAMAASPTWASHPSAVISSISGTLNFTLGTHFGMRGANVGFVSACASSAHALGYALDDLRRGRIESAIVLGAEDFSPHSILPFAGLRALSSHQDPRRVAPFDVGRDGFVGTGGAVALCLERADAARRRRATPYAQLLGWGQSADGGGITQPAPDGKGLSLALRRALHDARRPADEVDYINAHATATPVGDLAEGRALLRFLPEASPELRISSTKHLTGHSLSMAGALEAGLCALMLREGFIAGNDHLTTVESELAALPLPQHSEKAAPRFVLSNSSGFGGSNVVLALAPV